MEVLLSFFLDSEEWSKTKSVNVASPKAFPNFAMTKFNRLKFLGSSNIGEPCHCKALKAFKLLGIVLIKSPSKDNDFKFLRSPTFEGNPIPSPNEHPPRFK
jgi:hypothetical protein